MIAHVVLMKPRANLTESDRRAFVEIFERAVRTIASVRSITIGRRVRHGAGYEAVAPDAADYLAVIEFDDVHALREYLAHPAHAELGEMFGRILSGASVYDFEVGGLESIRRLAEPV